MILTRELMTRRSLGLFSGRTRLLARHHKPSTLSIRTLIKEFKVGDKVAIVPKGSFRDIPHPRYRGKIGTVTERRGSAYMVRVRNMSSYKTVIVPARHLEKAGASK